MSSTTPSWVATGLYIAACIGLAVVHDGLMFGWIADVAPDRYKYLLPLAGPSLALNTHLSILLFAPIAAVLALPLLAAVRSSGSLRLFGIVTFGLGWLATGFWLATLF